TPRDASTAGRVRLARIRGGGVSTYHEAGLTYESVPIDQRTTFNWHSGFGDWVRPVRKGAGITPAFLEQLIKRSEDAELILQDCGRLRFQRALQAAVDLYLEQQGGK